MLAVTGAAGFVGRRLLASVVQRGHRVAALLRPGESAAGLPSTTQVVVGELQQREAAVQLLDGADVFVHLAALGVQRGDRDWEQTVRTNALDPLRWIEEAVRKGVRQLVAVGTCLEYGGHGALPDAPCLAAPRLSEDSPLDPRGAYGASKAAGGVLLRARARDAGLAVVYLRLASLYGPGDNPAKLLPAAIRAARLRIPFEMTAGEQVREWLHIDDAAEALLAAVQTTSAPATGLTLNVGTGTGERLRDVVEQVFALSGAPAQLVRAGAVPYPRGEPHRLVMDVTRSRAVLGWSAAISLSDGLAALVEVT